jgi:glucokinase
MVDEGWLTSVKVTGEGGEVTCKDIFDGAAAGDPLARHVADKTAVYIGMLVNTLAETLNPERCIIFGGMSRAGGWFFEGIRKACDKGNGHIGPGRVQIVPALLGPDAGLIGAADYARGRAGA